MTELYCSEECRLIHETTNKRLRAIAQKVSDHDQRFDTLQTPWWKRLAFWIDGWPWYDLNGVQKHRPWHGLRAAIIRRIHVSN